MADIWSDATGGATHSGSWSLFGVPLPDLGLTEGLSGGNVNNQGGSNLVPDQYQNAVAAGAKAVTGGALNVSTPGAAKGATTPAPAAGGSSGGGSGGGGGGGYTDSSPGGFGSASNPDLSNQYKKDRYEEYLRSQTGSQNDAAAAAAEARRQAARRSYEGKVNAANVAKDAAKGQYDWLVDTLGSNKKDALDEVALNEQTGVTEYERQDVKTRENYDKAKKEILSTYRDLSREQEKILRGAGVQSSSRSVEAQLKLNNLLGKDMSEVTTNEADSLAQIGTALATFKDKVALTRNQIESEANSQKSKADLDYNNQVKVINANLQLSANEREDAYAAAEVQLAQDTANIQKWAAGIRLQVEMSIAQQAGTLDDFISDMTDSTALLNTDINTKTAATQEFVNNISSSVTLDAEGNLSLPEGGGRFSKQQSIASIYDPEKVGLAGVGASTAGGAQQSGSTQNLSRDPLLAAIA